jgi:hypothetical protein
MENSSSGNSWVQKIGFITGPGMILVGLLALSYSKKSPFMAYFIIAFGVIRLCMTIFLYFKQKKQPNNE